MIHKVRAIRVTLPTSFAPISGDFLMNVLDMCLESVLADKCAFTARTRETIATVFTFDMCNQLELVLKNCPAVGAGILTSLLPSDPGPIRSNGEMSHDIHGYPSVCSGLVRVYNCHVVVRITSEVRKHLGKTQKL